jgi:hypothetical protein
MTAASMLLAALIAVAATPALAQGGNVINVAGVVDKIEVEFGGGESELVVDPGVLVTRIDAADVGLVKSGALG